MDYIGSKCPVCDKYFHIGDDIVVCPECGTPSHRECYNNLGRCVNFDKHKDGFDYTNNPENKQADDNVVVCKKCGMVNPENAFFCEKCSAPLQEVQNFNNNPYNTQQPQGMPNMGPNVIMFDPLAGVNPETDLGDGVTAGECAKFTKQNTPYFSTVFNNIKIFSKSRYNFCAFLFGGGYLLYRKMYKLGTIITIIQAIMMISINYLDYYILSSGAFERVFEASQSGDFNGAMNLIYQLDAFNQYMFIIYSVLLVLYLALKIVIGACANRMYFNHCKKQIKQIKANNTVGFDKDKEYVKKGGVNVPLAMSLLISEMIVSYLPSFFM